MARKMCESCGMPLKDKDFGLRADGTKSNYYCSYCYDNGKFRHPDATAEQMIEYSVKGMSEDGKWPKFIAKFLTKNIPNLPRWQQEDTSIARD